MKIGIDFNQFTFPQLRRAFRKLGYTTIYDRLDLFCLDTSGSSKSAKGQILRVANRIPPLKQLALLFSTGTLFVCIK